MGIFDALKRALGPSEPEGTVHVHLVLKGRTAEGWYDVDLHLALPPGATLATLLAEADARRIPLREAIASSPHLAHTLMLNGERCPVEENLARPLAEGDQIYLLSPFAGG